MVGHLLEYHPGLVRLKELVDSGDLGDVHYIYGNRVNLGKVRADENALWSLGAHDVSVVLRLAEEEPVQCHAFGESYVRDGVEDVVFCYLRFPSGVAAHLHLSWLDPHKERRFTVVGSRRMATFDDMAIEQKLTVYDKGVDQPYKSYGEYIARSGDVWSPSVPNDEPLRLECSHFLECVVERRDAALRRRERAARRARAGGAADLARLRGPGARRGLAEPRLGAVGDQAGQRQRRGGGGRGRVPHVQRALGLRDHEVVHQAAVAAQGLGAHAGEVGLEVARLEAGHVVGRRAGERALAHRVAHLAEAGAPPAQRHPPGAGPGGGARRARRAGRGARWGPSDTSPSMCRVRCTPRKGSDGSGTG